MGVIPSFFLPSFLLPVGKQSQLLLQPTEVELGFSSRSGVGAQVGGNNSGFTPIFRVFGLFWMVSGGTSSKELNNARKSSYLPLLKALEAKLSFKVGKVSWVYISEVGKNFCVP